MYLFVLLLPAAGAGLTGSKMARRVGGVDEFEFKAIGENHNQGVGFDIFHIPVFLWHSLLKLSCDLCFCMCMCELCLAFLVVSNNTSALGYYFKLDSVELLLAEARGWDLSLRICLWEGRFYKAMGRTEWQLGEVQQWTFSFNNTSTTGQGRWFHLGIFYVDATCW